MLSETPTVRSLPSSLGFGCFVAKNGASCEFALRSLSVFSSEFSHFTFSTDTSKSTPLQHVWDVVLFFYGSKNGRELNDAPVRKLSQSFKLENVAGKSITSKQVL